jgi:thiamine-phosphate pyrophosphorylase
VVINDRADIARLSKAGGLHLGQDDLPPAHARTLVGTDILIGRSTHTTGQLTAAVVEPVGYVAIGPVFGTASKDTGYNAVGLEMVRHAAQIAGGRQLPVVAIGGITLERAAAVIEAGAASVAVIGDLLSTGDPAGRVRDYLRRLAI